MQLQFDAMTAMNIQELLATACARQLSGDELDQLNESFVEQTGGGLDHHLGVRYIEVGPEKVECRVTIDQRHLQPWGVTNGGVYCSIGESVASIAGFIAAGGRATVMGVANNTDFFKPSRPGDAIRAVARPVNVGRTSQVWEVLMVNEDTQRLLARTNLRTAVIASEN